MDLAVGDGDGPAVVVDVGVVSAAQEGEVCHCGVAAVEPVDYVVGVAPTPFSRTPVTVV